MFFINQFRRWLFIKRLNTELKNTGPLWRKRALVLLAAIDTEVFRDYSYIDSMGVNVWSRYQRINHLTAELYGNLSSLRRDSLVYFRNDPVVKYPLDVYLTYIDGKIQPPYHDIADFKSVAQNFCALLEPGDSVDVGNIGYNYRLATPIFQEIAMLAKYLIEMTNRRHGVNTPLTF